MASTPQSDWRLTNQEKYLIGVTLQLRKFCVRADRTDWDHEHCEFCWVKIVEKKEDEVTALLTEAYSTADGARWICPTCFKDFRERFEWTIAGEKTA